MSRYTCPVTVASMKKNGLMTEFSVNPHQTFNLGFIRENNVVYVRVVILNSQKHFSCKMCPKRTIIGLYVVTKLDFESAQM